MKKFFIFCLAVLVVASIAGYLRADVVYTRGGDARISTVSFQSTTKTLNSTVAIGNLILGATYSDDTAGWGTLYDKATAAAAGATDAFAEIYVAAGGANTVIFPLPKKIAYGLVLDNANSTGMLIVYYE